ncbi:MAG: hypothetical protein QXM02_06865 [Thermoproteota archaeon]
MTVKGVYFSILVLILGVFMFVASFWLTWDWINSIVNGPWIDWKEFCEGWSFYAPLFIHKWDCRTWTGPYDTALLLGGLSIVLLVASAFILGRLTSRVKQQFNLIYGDDTR